MDESSPRFRRTRACSRKNTEPPMHKRKYFSKEEDQKLIELVAKYGKDWVLIAEKMPERCIRQCRDRYEFYLDPNLNVEPFTLEEDKLLLHTIEISGKMWSQIANFFPGRTVIMLKNRYNQLIKSIVRMNREINDGVKPRGRGKRDDGQNMNTKTDRENIYQNVPVFPDLDHIFNGENKKQNREDEDSPLEILSETDFDTSSFIENSISFNTDVKDFFSGFSF